MSSVHAYPPAEPHRIIPSTVHSRTEPARGGFMKSMMGRHDISDFDEGVVMFNQNERKVTQEEQDVEDAKARKRAMRDLINSWQERLQLISVITTFFATTEAAMLVNTKPLSIEEFGRHALKVSNAGLLGSLVLHVYASVLSFLGAFLLISYKLREAARAEMIVEGIPVANSPLGATTSKDVEWDAIDPGVPRTLTNNDAKSMMNKSVNYNTAASVPGRNKRDLPFLVEPQPLVFSTDPHIEQVGPLASHASSHQLLSRIHAVCVFLTAAGFVLAIVGIVAYAWALQPRAVSIFTSVCLGGALLAMIALVM